MIKGSKIKEMRESNNISQKELAERIGVSYSIISMYESGKKNLSLPTITKISKYFDAPIEFFMDQAENERNTNTTKRLQKYRKKNNEQLVSLNNNGSQSLASVPDIKALITYYSSVSLPILSSLCKNERIEKDLTEKYVATNCEIPLNDYIEFESSAKNIGTDNIVVILVFLGLEVNFVAGCLTGALFGMLSTKNEKNAAFDNLSISGLMRKLINQIDQLDQDQLNEFGNLAQFDKIKDDNLTTKFNKAFNSQSTEELLDAAHEIKNSTNEEKHHDEDLMNDENNWK